MKFFTSKVLPKEINEGTADNPSYIDQIHDLIHKGYSPDEINKAIDSHPDMWSKEAFKEYAKQIHKPLSEHYAKIKSNEKNA